MKDIVGFLLTRQWRDTAEGLVLRYWLTSDVGPLLIEQKNQEGVFFVESEVSEKAKAQIRHQFHRTKALSLKTFYQKPVNAFYFTQHKQLRQAATVLKDHGIEPLEYDVRSVDRYLMERFITASMRVKANLVETHHNFEYVCNATLRPEKFDPIFKVVSFDIETAYPSTKLLSIAVYSDTVQKVFMVSSGQDEWQARSTIDCRVVADERSLLIEFIDWLQDNDPDILIGWNCINFDLRVLDQACQRYGFKLSIGRNKENIEWRTSPNNEEHYFVLVPGRAVLDGIDTLKSASYHFESFSLEFVSQALLGKGKLIHDPDDRGDEILRLYIEEDQSAQAIIANGFEADAVNRVIRLVDVNEYKRRQAPVGVRLTQRGFGRDRRYPITNGWRAGK